MLYLSHMYWGRDVTNYCNHGNVMCCHPMGFLVKGCCLIPQPLTTNVDCDPVYRPDYPANINFKYGSSSVSCLGFTQSIFVNSRLHPSFNETHTNPLTMSHQLALSSSHSHSFTLLHPHSPISSLSHPLTLPFIHSSTHSLTLPPLTLPPSI